MICQLLAQPEQLEMATFEISMAAPLDTPPEVFGDVTYADNGPAPTDIDASCASTHLHKGKGILQGSATIEL